MLLLCVLSCRLFAKYRATQPNLKGTKMAWLGENATFVTEPEERFMCSICQDVMQSPVETSCGHCFCRTCLSTWLRNSSTCPVERQLLSEQDIHTSNNLARAINNLKLRCPNGCGQTPTVQYYQEHLQNCQTSCPNGQARLARQAPAIFDVYVNPANRNALNNQRRGDHVNARNAPVNNMCSDGQSSQGQCRVSRCRSVFIVLFVLLLICIIAIVFPILIEFVFKENDPHQAVLNTPCSPHTDICTDPSANLRLSCDISQHVCLLQAGETCGGNHKALCVTGAFCDTGTKRCVCEWGLHAEQGVCVLKRGEKCDGRLKGLCWQESYCDLNTTGLCQCYKEYIPSGGSCRLKAEVADVRCSQVTACVENAACDSQTEQCLCDKDFSTKRDGTCGLQVSVRQSQRTCVNFPPCVDNATCSNTQHSCVCDQNFAQISSGTCGLKVKVPNVDCNYATNCVHYAQCDRATGKCLCESDFNAKRDGTCGLKASVRQEGKACADFPPCVDNATCSETHHSCVCNDNFLELSDGTCGLKVEVHNADCLHVSSCVENAACNHWTRRCGCFPNFSAKRDGTCGLKASVRLANKACSDFPPCVEFAQCSELQHSCLCEYNFAQLTNGTCGLKAKVSTVDCRHVTSCVEKATCQKVGGGYQCICNNSTLTDDTCGFRLNSAATDCRATGCKKHYKCVHDWDTRTYFCQKFCHRVWFKLKCDGSIVVPSLMVTAVATIASTVLSVSL